MLLSTLSLALIHLVLQAARVGMLFYHKNVYCVTYEVYIGFVTLFLADGLEDGLYTIQHSSCPTRYLSYIRSRRYPSTVDLRNINTSKRKIVWKLKNLVGGSVSLQAHERPLGTSGMLSYKSSCRSKWTGIQKRGQWVMKTYSTELTRGSSYTIAAQVLVQFLHVIL